MPERLPQLSYESLAPGVRPLADDILKVSSAALGGPYNALLRSPDMARRCFDLLDYLRFKTTVNKRLNEFAILIQARIANAQYEWWAHLKSSSMKSCATSISPIRLHRSCRLMILSRSSAFSKDSRPMATRGVLQRVGMVVKSAIRMECSGAIGPAKSVNATSMTPGCRL